MNTSPGVSESTLETPSHNGPSAGRANPATTVEQTGRAENMQGVFKADSARVYEERLISAAKRWASFQEGDSLEDQATDERLKAEAIAAREHLLDAINALEGR